MKIDILSIFPEYFSPLDLSLIGRARAAGLAVNNCSTIFADVSARMPNILLKAYSSPRLAIDDNRGSLKISMAR